MVHAAFLACVALGLPCRYTVRDVAFVDLGDSPYRLVCYVEEEDGVGRRDELNDLFPAVLGDSNVEGRLLDPDSSLELADAKRLARHRVQDFPFTALVGPSGRELVLRWSGDGADPESLASRLVDSAVHSPLRARIAERLAESFCLLILIESGDATANERARREVDEALSRVGGILEEAPKDVGGPPELLVIGASQRERERERVLCWSLGLDDLERETPAVAVLMGRGRRAGPLLSGTALDRERLFGILATVGLSCECDLDRSWMRGERIPMRWDGATKRHVADRLGFDPDSPRVRAEITSILAHRGAPGTGSAAPTVDEILLAYREEVVLPADSAESAEVPEIPGAREPPPAAPPPAGDREPSGGAALRNLLITLSVIAGLSVIVSVTVLVRTRPR